MFARLQDVASGVVMDVPVVDPAEPPGAEKITQLINWAAWVVTALGVVAIILVGAYLMFHNDRGEGSNAQTKLGSVLGGLVLISAASAIVGLLV